MAFATESARTEHEPQHHSVESATRETAGQESALFHGGLLSAAASNGSNGSGHPLLTHPVMRHSTGNWVRAMVLHQAQQGMGNLKMQQVLIQPRRSSLIQRECACGGTCSACQEMGVDEETESQIVQRQATAAPDGGTVDADIIPNDSPGYPLDEGTRSFMESRFETDFSDVRVHTDNRAAESADALSANAYTTGRDIYFAAGKYAPSSRDGQHLLAHELTHTVQQEGAARSVATNRSGSVTVGAANTAMEQEAEETADTIVRSGRGDSRGSAVERPEGNLPGRSSLVQRDSADAAQTASDDSVKSQLEDETKAWQALADQDTDLLLRARASRMVLLLTWHTPMPTTLEEYTKFTAECDKLSQTELDTLQAFTAAGQELALAGFPKGFPLTWKGRIHSALSLGADVIGLWTEYTKELNELLKFSKVLPPELVRHGLPVSFDNLRRLDDFHVYPADALSPKDSPVRNYAGESIRYIQIRWITAFAITWEKTADQIASDVGDGKLVVNYPDWKDFVENKQAILRALPDRARNRIPDDPEQLQNESLPLKDAALLAGFVSSLVAIFGGILQGWKDASSYFDLALTTADATVAAGEDGEKLAMAAVWAWENDYFSGAAKEWADNAIHNAGAILKDLLRDFALLLIAQFIPVVDVAVDVYFAARLGLDVLSWIDDLRSVFKQISNAGTVGKLQRAGARFAEVLNSGAIQLLIAVVTWGIGKAVSKVRARAKELRAESKDLSASAAERKALEEMSPAERKPLEEAGIDKSHSATERLSGEKSVPLEKGEVRVTQEGRCKICQSPCKYELDMAREILQAKMGTEFQGYAENLLSRVRLLDEAMQASQASGNLGREFNSRFRESLNKLSSEVSRAHLRLVGGSEGVSLAAAEEIEGFRGRKQKGIVDDPEPRYSPERALEGTAYHEHIEAKVLRSLPKGTVYSENTVQDFLRKLGVDPKSIPAKSQGIDLYVKDGSRKLIVPVDVTNVAGGKVHVGKLQRDVGRLQGELERVGWHLSDPIEIEYVGMTYDEAATSIVSELRPYARP